MIIHKDDKKAWYFHGITAFDAEGKSIKRVVEIDTESLTCKVGPLGKTVQAAGFVIFMNIHLADFLPDGLFPFVCPHVNPTEEQAQDFVRELLNRRKRYETVRKRALDPSPEWAKKIPIEETFDWPRPAFIGLADRVKPEDEAEDTTKYSTLNIPHNVVFTVKYRQDTKTKILKGKKMRFCNVRVDLQTTEKGRSAFRWSGEVAATKKEYMVNALWEVAAVASDDSGSILPLLEDSMWRLAMVSPAEGKLVRLHFVRFA